jgi:hypothetical protein
MKNKAELARSYWEQSLPFFRELCGKVGLMWALHYLSELAMAHGDRTAARRLLEERLQLNRQLGNIEEVLRATQLLAQLEVTTT